MSSNREQPADPLRDFAQWVLDSYHSDEWPEAKNFAREARAALEATPKAEPPCARDFSKPCTCDHEDNCPNAIAQAQRPADKPQVETGTGAPLLSDELLPCPFCGGPGELLQRWVGGDTRNYTVECRWCDSAIGEVGEREFAAKKWNGRAVIAAHQQPK